ncbi:uncharacterized protein LOC100275771 [Zea mays]|jgi:hypothetical protein|uniref:Uncharacterized protein n=1 Tax=Zea mays TaxID=4577 RepID=A0A1D6IJG9_MAIZE|nr:uncharacterized protein LOC100275771 [Zea mays]ONM59588.1 hypothetical protein ZEAMMB73_Zm00001d022127 [Zea mays]|eukprot:NP_001143246.2 uncharacterized protein LOC100275771 [Zea mays]
MVGASARPSAGRDGGPETALPKLQLLPCWLDGAVVKLVAADGDGDDLLAGSASSGKRRPTAQAAAGLARGVKALLSEVAEMIRTKFGRSIPAAKFGHVAYIR